MPGIVLLVLIVALGLWAAASYNRLVGMRNQVLNGWRQIEGQLTQALGRLLALAESYPTLKSNDNVKMLQEELSATENKVGFARQFYNDIVTKFNTAQQVFPANLLAGAFGFRPSELFEITEAADREVPVVDLSRKYGGSSPPRRESLRAAIIQPTSDVADHARLRRLPVPAGPRLRRLRHRRGRSGGAHRVGDGARHRIRVSACQLLRWRS